MLFRSDTDATVTYTVNFSEAVQTLTATDVSVTGGTLVEGSIHMADGGLSATFQATATDGSTTDLVATVNESVRDLAGNTLAAISSSTLSVDTINPTVATITTNNTDGVVSDTDATVTYTVNFSEAVQTLTATDVSVTGGTLVDGSIHMINGGLSATFQARSEERRVGKEC